MSTYPTKPVALSVKQFAEAIGFKTTAAVYYAIAKGRIKAGKIWGDTGDLRIPVSELERIQRELEGDYEAK